MPAPRGSRDIAVHSLSPCLSSVISQTRGRGWRRCMALPIAAAMNDASPEQRLSEIRSAIGKAARQPRSRPGHPDRGLQDPSRGGGAAADRRRPARLRRESRPGGAGEMARDQGRDGGHRPAPDRRPPVEQGGRSGRPVRRHPFGGPAFAGRGAGAGDDEARPPSRLLPPSQYRRRAAARSPSFPLCSTQRRRPACLSSA